MITIYGKPGCNECVMAQKLCEKNYVQYEYLSLGKDYDMDKLNELVNENKTREMPIIMHNNIFIGSTKQLHELLKRS